MPTYPDRDSLRGYFYNNKVINGVNDREYSAKDIRKPYDAVFTDGVKPEADGTVGGVLKVTASGGMAITVAEGYAKLGGAPVENNAPYLITLDDATSTVRYDCVIMRNDDTDDVRRPSIYVKSLARIPVLSDLERNENVYEICLAYVVVPAFATSIFDKDIVDTRDDGVLCNAMSGVGAMVVRTFRNTYFSETTNQKIIPIGIEQFKKERDQLTVMIEGRIFSEGASYTVVDNEYISLAIGLPVIGTKIEFEVAKNVNAAGAETVVLEVADLMKGMALVKKKTEYDYYCNGVNDNVNISNIVKAYLQGGSDYGTMRINVIGHFGMTSHISGAGTYNSPNIWFDFNVQSNRKAVVDFSRCTDIVPVIADGTYNVIFHSNNGMSIKSANVVANNQTVNTTIRVTFTMYGAIEFEDCRFWITAYTNSLIGLRGTYKNCRGSVANVVGNSYCFQPDTNSIVRILGGEYYSYTGESSKQSAIVGQSATDAVTIMYGVNAPTVARTGFYQTNSLLQWVSGGILSCTDLISSLPMTVVSGISNIRGTIAKSKPGAM